MTISRTVEQIQDELAALKAADGFFVLDDSVRGLCETEHTKGPFIGRWNISCAEAGCKGWVASRDILVWEQATVKYADTVIVTRLSNGGYLVKLAGLPGQPFAPGATIHKARIRALEKALLLKEKP